MFGNLEEDRNFKSINFDDKREWEDSDAKDIAEIQLNREWHFTLSDIKEAVEEEKEVWLPVLEKSQTNLNIKPEKLSMYPDREP